MIILLHTSKTMRRVPSRPGEPLHRPLLMDQAEQLAGYLQTLTPGELARVMSISPALAAKTHRLIAEWTADPADQSPALDSFSGDIYSGLHANDLAPEDRAYADRRLFVLSGLYGLLRPFDGISPYRLEMGYKLPAPEYASLYAFWGDAIARCLPEAGPIINLTAVEYGQVVTRYVDPGRVTAPRFLTRSPKTGQPEFVVVHAKIARGAFARWLITNRISSTGDLPAFAELGYRYTPELDTPEGPAFLCEEFGGKGLSIRLD